MANVEKGHLNILRSLNIFRCISADQYNELIIANDTRLNMIITDW